MLLDPTRGVMVVEVKGGEVWCERGEWRQRNRKTGYVEVIFPETQASDTMHRIRLDVVKKVPPAANLLFCHAVWFPDGTVDRMLRLPMNYHPAMTLDAEDTAHAAAAIQRAFDYWHAVLPPGWAKVSTQRRLNWLSMPWPPRSPLFALSARLSMSARSSLSSLRWSRLA